MPVNRAAALNEHPAKLQHSLADSAFKDAIDNLIACIGKHADSAESLLQDAYDPDITSLR